MSKMLQLTLDDSAVSDYTIPTTTPKQLSKNKLCVSDSENDECGSPAEKESKVVTKNIFLDKSETFEENEIGFGNQKKEEELKIVDSEIDDFGETVPNKKKERNDFENEYETDEECIDYHKEAQDLKDQEFMKLKEQHQFLANEYNKLYESKVDLEEEIQNIKSLSESEKQTHEMQTQMLLKECGERIEQFGDMELRLKEIQKQRDELQEKLQDQSQNLNSNAEFLIQYDEISNENDEFREKIKKLEHEIKKQIIEIKNLTSKNEKLFLHHEIDLRKIKRLEKQNKDLKAEMKISQKQSEISNDDKNLLTQVKKCFAAENVSSLPQLKQKLCKSSSEIEEEKEENKRLLYRNMELMDIIKIKERLIKEFEHKEKYGDSDWSFEGEEESEITQTNDIPNTTNSKISKLKVNSNSKDQNLNNSAVKNIKRNKKQRFGKWIRNFFKSFFPCCQAVGVK